MTALEIAVAEYRRIVTAAKAAGEDLDRAVEARQAAERAEAAAEEAHDDARRAVEDAADALHLAAMQGGEP